MQIRAAQARTANLQALYSCLYDLYVAWGNNETIEQSMKAFSAQYDQVRLGLTPDWFRFLDNYDQWEIIRDRDLRINN